MIRPAPEGSDPTEWFGVSHTLEHGWTDVERRGGSDAAMLACAAHLAERGETDRLVSIIGDSAGADAARSLGMTVADVVPHAPWPRWPAPRAPRRAATLTRALWHAAAPAQPGTHDILRAFDGPSDALRRVARRAVRVDVFTPRDRNLWAQVGVGARLTELPDFTPLANARRPASRIGSPTSSLVAIVADRPGDLDARQFGFLLGLLAVAGHRVDGLMPREARDGHLVRRHIAGLDEPCRVFESRVTTLATLARAHLALVPPRVPEGSGAELVIRRWCEALGVAFIRFEQQPLGERRQTPALAVPVIEALERIGAAS
ncbi:MAG: hypothetical protein RIB60_08935 [Phycisphaerales bacterium]